MTNKLATYQIQIKQFYGKDRTLPCDFFNLIFTFFLFVFFLNLDFILPQNTQVRLVAFYSIPQIFLFLRQKLTTTKYPRHEFFFRGGERRTGSATLIYKYTLHKDAVLAVLALSNCHWNYQLSKTLQDFLYQYNDILVGTIPEKCNQVEQQLANVTGRGFIRQVIEG